jgi:hypothetical protein
MEKFIVPPFIKKVIFFKMFKMYAKTPQSKQHLQEIVSDTSVLQPTKCNVCSKDRSVEDCECCGCSHLEKDKTKIVVNPDGQTYFVLKVNSHRCLAHSPRQQRVEYMLCEYIMGFMDFVLGLTPEEFDEELGVIINQLKKWFSSGQTLKYDSNTKNDMGVLHQDWPEGFLCPSSGGEFTTKWCIVHPIGPDGTFRHNCCQDRYNELSSSTFEDGEPVWDFVSRQIQKDWIKTL